MKPVEKAVNKESRLRRIVPGSTRGAVNSVRDFKNIR
jgi:hypothetical protein